MKRIVQCPKCESKLAVFDLGKPISQKCPRCGNAFEIQSEERKEGTAEKTTEKKKSKKLAAAEKAAEKGDAAVAPDKENAAPDAAASKASDSDAAKPSPKADEPLQAANKADAKAEPETKADKKTEPEKKADSAVKADEKKPEEKSPEEKITGTLADKKEISLKKQAGRPVTPMPRTAAPAQGASDEKPPAPAHGVSFLHIVVLFGLVVLAIAMQMVGHKKMQARLDKMDGDIDKIVKQVQALSKK